MYQSSRIQNSHDGIYENSSLYSSTVQLNSKAYGINEETGKISA